MWKRLPLRTPARKSSFSFSPAAAATATAASDDIPTLYSFLQPSIFAIRKPPNPKPTTPNSPKTLTLAPNPAPSALESSLRSALQSLNTEDAWKSFRSLAALSLLPPPDLSDDLVAQLASVPTDRQSLKRSLAAAILILARAPHSLSAAALSALVAALAAANPSAALALLRAAFKARRFPPFASWGPILIQRPHLSSVSAVLQVFEENCRVYLKERVEWMKPDMGSCNAVLELCCKVLGSASDAERVVEMMSAMDTPPDLRSYGWLAYLYASKGHKSRVEELDKLMDALGFEDKSLFFGSLIRGYVKSRDFELVSSVILRVLRDGGEKDCNFFGEETYLEIVNGFVEDGRIKDLASLIIDAQELESLDVQVESSVGFGVINACVGLGFLDKAHNILDEMNARGAAVGLGVYSSILKAYCKEQRTAEAAQLATEIAAAGLLLEPDSYDALIDSSMSAQDFQSAFSLFREMREARLPDLKTSYLTIMTGLTANNRPELMAAFLDSVVNDPRIEIATHDWNSIIHAFCKVGRLEDSRRTYRRMVFLRFEPNNQTYLSLINGYVSAEKYFSVLILWTEVRKKGIKFDHDLIEAFLYALVKGGFFDAAMQVVEKAQELKIFIDKWRHKQAFMESHKKLKVAKLRKRNFRKMEALVAFKNWAGLNA